MALNTPYELPQVQVLFSSCTVCVSIVTEEGVHSWQQAFSNVLCFLCYIISSKLKVRRLGISVSERMMDREPWKMCLQGLIVVTVNCPLGLLISGEMHTR
ncbi:hypothetical protein MTO96_017731 [Rhipicephalus appendiculatus]